MRYLLLSFLLFTTIVHKMHAQSTSSLKWKHRILILMDAQGDLKARQAQLASLSKETEGLKERDLIIFCFDGGTLLDASLNPTSYKLASNVDKDFQGVILIGKDGGIKLAKSFPVAPELIFATIDQMPMRKAEMRKSGND